MFKSLKFITKWIFIIYLTLGVFIWLFSPLVIRHITNNAIEAHNLVLSSDSSIRYNLFSTHISVSDLKLYPLDNPNEVAISIKDLDFELALHQFIFDEIYISELFIDGLNINTSLEDDKLIIAGIALNDDSKSEVIDEEEQPSESAQVDFPYTFVLPELAFINTNFNLVVNENAHKFTITELNIADFSASLKQQKIKLTLKSSLNDSPIMVNLDAKLNDNKGDVLLSLDLQKIALEKVQNFLPDNIKILQGKVSFKAKNKLTLNDNTMLLSVTDFNFLVEEFNFADDLYKTGFNNQALVSEAFTLNLSDFNSEINDVSLTYNLDELLVTTAVNDDVVISINHIELPEISYTDPATHQVTISGLNINNIIASDKVQDEYPGLLTLSAINIDNILLTDKSVDVGTVSLNDLSVEAEINEEKVLVSLITFPEKQVTKTVDVEPETESETTKQHAESKDVADPPPVFNFSLTEFKLNNPATINFVDKSIQPSYVQNLTIEQLSFDELNTRTPDNISQLKIIGKSNKYAKFETNLKTTPLAKVPNYKFKTNFYEVSLPEISGYLREPLEYEIESGQLDLIVDAEIDGSELSGDADIKLRGIEFKVLQEDEQKIAKSTIAFNTAIGMLKDSQGNVELNLPLSGDVNSPSFGVTGLITLLVKKATMSQAKDYLMTTFVPYASVVSIAMAAGEYALKVRVNDLNFTEGVTNLEESQQVFLEQLSALFKDDEDLQVKLCAYATPADINLPLSVEIHDKVITEKLNIMSIKRIENFKDFLVEKHGIKSSRLLLCKPRIDYDAEAKPSIKFVI